MKFKLYLELGTRAENEKVLDLLRFPTHASLGDGTKWSCVFWSQGHTKRIRSTDREQIVASISAEGLNELEFTGQATADMRLVAHPRVIDVWVHLTLSPMNILWAPVPEEILANHLDERKRQNFASNELIKAGHYSKPYPSIVEYMLAVEANGDVSSDIELQEISFDLVRATIPQTLADCDVFGYGCVDAKCRRALMTHNVAGRGASIDDLGEKFDNIYPLLVGPKDSCEALARVLAPVRMEPFSASGGSRSYILSVPPERAISPGPRPPDVLAPSALDPAVRQWLA